MTAVGCVTEAVGTGVPGAGNLQEGTFPARDWGQNQEGFPRGGAKVQPKRQTETSEADGTPEEGPSKQKHQCRQRPAAEREAVGAASLPNQLLSPWELVQGPWKLTLPINGWKVRDPWLALLVHTFNREALWAQ